MNAKTRRARRSERGRAVRPCERDGGREVGAGAPPGHGTHGVDRRVPTPGHRNAPHLRVVVPAWPRVSLQTDGELAGLFAIAQKPLETRGASVVLKGGARASKKDGPGKLKVGINNRAVMAGAFGAVVVALVGLQNCPPRQALFPAERAVEPEVPPATALSAQPPPRPRTGKVSSGPPRMLHLDPRRTNRSPYTGPRDPVIAWAFDTGGPIEAAPALLDDGTIIVASLGGKLHGISPDGAPKFSVDLDDRVYGSPLVLDNEIYVGSDARRFFALSPEGRIRFRLETHGDADTGATVTPWGGIVFAAGRMIYAIEPNGTLIYRVRTQRKTFASPAVGEDGTVFVGSQDDHVYAIDEKGSVKWRVDVGADADGGPAIADDGTVYVGTDGGEVIALDPEDGTIRWRKSVGGFVRGSLSVGRDGVIRVGTYGPKPRLVSLAPEDGEILWSFSIRGTGAREFGIHGAPVEDAEGRLYFGGQDDIVYALDLDGSLVWKLETGGDVDASLVITEDGTLLVGSADGKLYALRNAGR